jgi:hypothetical protein
MKYTQQKVLKELKDILNNPMRDTETDHIKADAVLCNLLKSLGYKNVVKEYEKIKKWFA